MDDTIDALEALLARVPLDAADRARGEKLIRRLSRHDPEASAKYADDLRLPVRIEASPVLPRRRGRGGLRAPVGDALTLVDPLGPALDAWWATATDRRPLVTALLLAYPHAAPGPAAEMVALIRAVASGADGVWPAARKVLNTWPGCAAPLGLPLDGPVEPPKADPAEVRAARVALGGRRRVDVDEFAVLWRALPGGRWVDLGSGNGATKAGLRHTGRQVIGVDVAPPADVVIPVSPWPEVMRAAAVRGVGAPVDAVVLCYPSHAEQVTAAGRKARAVVFQLETAIELLRPGGVVALFTESPGVMRAALAATAVPRVQAVDLLDGPLGEHALRDLGIVPYTPRVNDLTGVGTDTRPVRPFGWAFAALVWTR